jgi:hypothetical protein
MYGRLIFDNDVMNFLDNTSENKISYLLLTANSDNGHLVEEGNFIKRSSIDFECFAYIPKNKYGVINDLDCDIYHEKVNRTRTRVGKFINKFLSKEAINANNITSSDIEKFVNLYKSYFARNESMLKIVSGNDIFQWYLDVNYFAPPNFYGTTLWKSCMRQEERNKFMQLYTQNNTIKMLVYLTDNGKVRARALLWDDVKDTNGNSYKIMDRIYSVFDHDVDFFKDWAKENGYIPKFEQNSKSERLFLVDGVPQRMDLYIDLEVKDFRYYPYLDTFKFFDIRKGKLSNNGNCFPFDYVLVQSNGSLVSDRNNDNDDDH